MTKIAVGRTPGRYCSRVPRIRLDALARSALRVRQRRRQQNKLAFAGIKVQLSHSRKPNFSLPISESYRKSEGRQGNGASLVSESYLEAAYCGWRKSVGLLGAR